MNWRTNQKDSAINRQYYSQNGEFTLCKIGVEKVTFELWHKSTKLSIHNNKQDALDEFREITK